MLVIFYKSIFFWEYIKISEISDLTYYQENRDLILNKAKDYYKNNKERLKEQLRDKNRSLPEEKKIKRENTERTGIIIYMPKEKKQGLTEYQKNYRFF